MKLEMKTTTKKYQLIAASKPQYNYYFEIMKLEHTLDSEDMETEYCFRVVEENGKLKHVISDFEMTDATNEIFKLENGGLLKGLTGLVKCISVEKETEVEDL